MRRWISTGLLTMLAVLAPPASAQIGNCLDCTLGLYDEPQLLNTFGDIVPFTLKDIYLGVKYAPPESRLIVLEFSISGLHSGSNVIVTNVEGVTTPPVNFILGSIAAPQDTSATSTGTGGADVAWQGCLVGSQALLKITLLAVAPVSNHVLRVMHRFPPSNPMYGRANPILVRCDEPTFTPVRLTGREYILGGVVAVAGETWARMKQLYR